MPKLTAYHGTAADYAGNPSPMTDAYGLTGIYLTESADDAAYFADANTEGRDDGPARVFTADVDMTDVEDLTEMEGEHDDIIAAAGNSRAAVVILPDMSGVSEREILVKNPSAITWGQPRIRRMNPNRSPDWRARCRVRRNYKKRWAVTYTSPNWTK